MRWGRQGQAPSSMEHLGVTIWTVLLSSSVLTHPSIPVLIPPSLGMEISCSIPPSIPLSQPPLSPQPCPRLSLPPCLTPSPVPTPTHPSPHPAGALCWVPPVVVGSPEVAGAGPAAPHVVAQAPELRLQREEGGHGAGVGPAWPRELPWGWGESGPRSVVWGGLWGGLGHSPRTGCRSARPRSVCSSNPR